MARQCGQEALLAGVVEPVGVGAKRGGLGDGGQPGEQSRATVGGDVVDMADAAQRDQLGGHQRGDIRGGGDLAGAGVAGSLDQTGQVERHEVGDGQQQPGEAGVELLGQLIEVEQPGTR